MLVSSVMIVFALLALVLCVGAVFLQVYLSKRENRFLGLLLPAATLLYAVLMVLNLSMSSELDGWMQAGLVIRAFLVANIPTLVLLAIYWIARENAKRNKQLEKMNIQDL